MAAASDVQAKEDLQEPEEKLQRQEAPESDQAGGAIGVPPPEEGTAPTVQPKLAMGAPGDRFEQEADAVAERVVQRMESGDIRGGRSSAVQAKYTACMEEEEEGKLRRQAELGDALPQARAGASSLAVPDSVQAALQGSGGTGRALNPPLREEMEQAFIADFSGVHIHTGNAAESLNRDLNARAFTYGKDIFFNAREFRLETREGRHLLAHELAHVVQQTGAPSGITPVQRKPKAKDEAIYVPYQIQVTRPMTGAEFTAEVERQVFGRVVNVKWLNVKSSYDPSQSPVTARVHVSLLEKLRGRARGERGITVDEKGDIKGAKERARVFQSGPESDQKTALMNEIDRRYFEAVGDQTGTKIKDGEEAKARLWRMIRDEVLFQQEYIANLPPKVKELIRFSTQGKVLTPADYDKLFSIAKKIEQMPPGQVSDYTSKVTATTTDLGVFETSLDRYLAEMAARAQQREGRDQIQTKLIGLEEVYKKYRLYKTLLSSGGGLAVAGRYGGGAGGGIVTTREAMKLRQEIDTAVKAHGFAGGITEFEAYITKFEKAFEQESATIAKDLLEKYSGKLYRESERYKNASEVAAQHQKIGGFRQSYSEFETNAQVWNEYVKTKDLHRIPGQGHLRSKHTLTEAEEARKKAEAAKASAQSQFKGLSEAHPVFQEESLPSDKRIDKVALAKASESELGVLLQTYIQKRLKYLGEARAEIEAKPELIYKMEKLMPQFYTQQGIKPGSIHDMIIQDKMRSDVIMKIVKGLALAMVAIALSVITFGTATPVIIAAGAGLAGAGLGVYMAVEEYKEYAQQKSLADVGLADDPSMVWVILAVAGAGLDVAAAVKAVRALAPAAKVLNAGGDIAEFTKAVRALEKANEIEAKVARAAEKAAEARKGLSQASKELTRVLGSKAYSFPGPLLDPDVYAAVVKMARQAIRTGFYDAQKFIEELKLARVSAGLGDLTPQEFAKAKQAWEEAKTLEAAEAALEAAEKARVGTYTSKIKWGIQEIDARPHTSIPGAFWGRRTPQAKARVEAYELKINPNNESFYLPMPDGGYAQFENVVGTTLVQDAKVIIEQRSWYHVADMPSIAAKSVLNEARRQVTAASAKGLRVEWLVSEARAKSQLEALFQKENVAVTVRLVPE